MNKPIKWIRIDGLIFIIFNILYYFSCIAFATTLAIHNPTFDSHPLLTQETIQETEQESGSLAKDKEPIPDNDISRFTSAIILIKDFYVQPVNDKHILDNAIRGIVSSLDPHSEYLDESAYESLMTTTSGEFGGIGIEIVPEYGILKVISPLDETPAYKAGIRAGDYIIAIDNQLVSEMLLQQSIDKMRGKIGSHIELTILRKGLKSPIKFKIQRQTIHVTSAKGKMLDHQFAYIRISQFQEPTAHLVHNIILDLKQKNNGKLNGMILDLRNNPGGLLEVAAQVVNDFLNSKTLSKQYNKLIVYTQGRLPETYYKVFTTGNDILHGAPIVVLINNGSASASEIVAGALQDYGRALIVGTQSFGKGTVQTIIPLDKLHALKLTTAFYHTPSGRMIQNIGITPDIQVDNLEIASGKIDKNLELVAPIKEFQLKNHLQNTTHHELNTQLMSDSDLILAKNDFQLFEALKVLRTIYLSGQAKKI